MFWHIVFGPYLVGLVERQMCGIGRARFAASVRLLFLFLTVSLVACGEPIATPEPIFLQATGSTAMSPVVAELAAVFGEQSSTVSLEVTALGTQYGLDALQAGTVDFALVSWLPADLPGWRATAIARDGIAIVVHPSNPLDGFGLLQLQDLFGGRIYEWKAVGGRTTQGPVQLVSREQGSGTRAAFEALVMGDYQVTPLAVVAPSSQAVVEYVAGHHNAIGYVTMDYVSLEVKVVQIEGELPTPETVGQGSYPLTRELWLVTTSPPPEAVQAFFDFVLSPSGQQIVGRHFGRIR
jgi:phosphate transport system substrate-binding protein